MTQDSQSKEVLKAVGTAFDAGTTAINRATDAATAIEVARSTDTASLLAKVDEKLKEHHEENKVEMRNMLNDVLGKVFGKEANSYVVPNRVPLLCQDVSYMKGSITEMKIAVADVHQLMKDLPKEIESKYATKLTEKIVNGLVALIIVAFMGALISLTFIK